MRINLRQFNKEKVIWLSEHKCKHGHSYLEHPQCYYEEHPDMIFNEKICFLDIEAGGGLQADFAVVLSWCIKGFGEKDIHYDYLKLEDLKNVRKTGEFDKPDKRLLESLVKTLLCYNRVVTHYGSRFDLPFVRSRCLYSGVEFPDYGSLYQDDTWRWAKYKLKLSSNRQANVMRFLYGDTEKTAIKQKHWIGALFGDKKSIEYIVAHNKIDVIELEKVWLKLLPYVRITKTSI